MPPLARGAGEGSILFLDAFSGIAGDMTMAALLDLGVPMSVVERALSALPLGGYHLHVGHVHRSAIVATSFDVHVEPNQPRRDYAAIDAMLSSSALDEETKRLARAIFGRLGEAEAFVHKMPLEQVHFHEVGAVDAIVDIVGTAAAIAYLGCSVVASPLPMGRGFVRAEHGRMPNPPPAVVEVLSGCPTYGIDLDFELVTPTGAAIVATLAQSFARWPSMAPTRTGYGAGRRELPDRPNLLRAVLGKPSSKASEVESGEASHVVLEANVDDLTGELAGHAIGVFLESGALDAWATPSTTKKGRPGLVVSVLARASDADRLSEAILRETTSIGVRRHGVSRVERPRRIVTVATRFGEVRCKISEGPFGPATSKPEFEDCARLAREHGVPVREVVAAAIASLAG